MIWDIGVHRTDDADVIDAASHLRENLTDLDPRFAHRVEGERRTHQGACFAFGFPVCQLGLISVMFGEFGFWVEGVDLRWAAIHEQVNQTFCLRAEMGLARGEWGGGRCGSLLSEEGAQSEETGSGADTGEKITAGDGEVHGVRDQSMKRNSFEISRAWQIRSIRSCFAVFFSSSGSC